MFLNNIFQIAKLRKKFYLKGKREFPFDQTLLSRVASLDLKSRPGDVISMKRASRLGNIVARKAKRARKRSAARASKGRRNRLNRSLAKRRAAAYRN